MPEGGASDIPLTLEDSQKEEVLIEGDMHATSTLQDTDMHRIDKEGDEIVVISVAEVVRPEVIQHDATENLKFDDAEVIVHDDTEKLMASPAASSAKERPVSAVKDTKIHTEVEDVGSSPAEVLAKSIDDASPRKSSCDVRIKYSQSEDIARDVDEHTEDISMRSDASREISHSEDQVLEENCQQVNQSIQEFQHGSADNGAVLTQIMTALAIVTDINGNNISNIKKNSPNKVLHDVVSCNVDVVEEEKKNIVMEEDKEEQVNVIVEKVFKYAGVSPKGMSSNKG
ncbi:hypothetical protein K7X08_031302 [Anisodus acutangulus]|uniref:Uncharacterized protein n=1 Tax=Anisodus acutangulus TaxID=402998 RepID=A0A9Q1RM17_9SOLA|nr:hypothetical protein K7X08_031302 [Anisodus acutangulus]